MTRMRYTGKCHTPKCKNWINEKMARFVATYWYYCPDCVDKMKTIQTNRQAQQHKPTLTYIRGVQNGNTIKTINKSS